MKSRVSMYVAEIFVFGPPNHSRATRHFFLYRLQIFIATISEEFSLLSNDLAFLKKLDLDLDKKITEQTYKGKKTVVAAAREEYAPKKPEIEYPPLPPKKWLAESCTEPGLGAAPRAAIAAAAALEAETTFAELLCMTDFKVLRGIVHAATVRARNFESPCFRSAFCSHYFL